MNIAATLEQFNSTENKQQAGQREKKLNVSINNTNGDEDWIKGVNTFCKFTQCEK